MASVAALFHCDTPRLFVGVLVQVAEAGLTMMAVLIEADAVGAGGIGDHCAESHAIERVLVGPPGLEAVS